MLLSNYFRPVQSRHLIRGVYRGYVGRCEGRTPRISVLVQSMTRWTLAPFFLETLTVCEGHWPTIR